jgi:hypothetical protein
MISISKSSQTPPNRVFFFENKASINQLRQVLLEGVVAEVDSALQRGETARLAIFER